MQIKIIYVSNFAHKDFHQCLLYSPKVLMKLYLNEIVEKFQFPRYLEWNIHGTSNRYSTRQLNPGNLISGTITKLFNLGTNFTKISDCPKLIQWQVVISSNDVETIPVFSIHRKFIASAISDYLHLMSETAHFPI